MRRQALGRVPMRLVFLFLGRNGFGQFALELASAAGGCPAIDATLGVARSSGLAARLDDRGARRFEVNTCGARALPGLIANFPAARRTLLQRLARERPAAVVTLMPHVWTPLLSAAIKRLGVLYVSIVHDAAAHPGDATGVVTPWLLRDTRHADLVITLSRAVADRLVSAGRVAEDKVVSLFHPDLNFGAAPVVRRRRAGDPLRLLFFGRILKYKGLPLLTEVVARLRVEGIRVELGVVGAGDLGDQRDKLAALGAEVINRWIDDHEVGPLLARYDAVALPYSEASQSGVAALAQGHCLPVIAMPVGGLPEQIADGRTGILAHGPRISSLADAIRKLAHDTALYDAMSREIAATAAARSMQRFLLELTDAIAGRLDERRLAAYSPFP